MSLIPPQPATATPTPTTNHGPPKINKKNRLRTPHLQWFLANSDIVLHSMAVQDREELAYQFLRCMKLPSHSVHRFALRISDEIKRDFTMMFPLEMCIEVFSQLSLHDMFNCMLASKRWYRLLSHSLIWRQAYFNSLWHFDLKQLQPSIHLNWQLIYQVRYQLEGNWVQGKCVKRTYSCKDDPDAHHDAIYTVQLDNKRGLMVSGSRDQTIKVWDMYTRKCIKTLVLHQASVLCLAIDLDRDIIVSGSSDNSIAVWNYSTGMANAVLRGHEDSVVNVQLYQNKIISCSKDTTIRIWDMDTFELLATLRGHKGAINAIQIANGKIASASGDRTVKIWDIVSGACLKTFLGHRHGVACLSFDGSIVISGSSDRTIHVFDTVNDTWLTTIYEAHDGLVRTVSMQNDILVSGSYDETIKLWKRRNISVPTTTPTITTLTPASAAGKKPCIAYLNKSIPAQNQQSWDVMYQLPKFGKLYNVVSSARYLIACSQDSTIACFDYGSDIQHIDLVSRFF
jgi:F-box and WD-40 domain protein 1/11